MPHISTNSEGLSVGDLIAELQRHDRREITTVGCVEWTRGAAFRLLDVISADALALRDYDEAIASRRAALKDLGSDVAALEKRSEVAREILLRIKRLSRQRPLPLPL